MADETELLRARVAQLTAENDRLRAGRPAGRQRWRGVVSAICLVLAAVLVPLSVVGVWTRAQLVDEQRFVSTLAPLAEDPKVQAVIVDRVDAAVQAQLDIPALTDTLFDGIAELGLPPAAGGALDLLRAPAAAGAQALVTDTIGELVRSDAFAAVWEQALTSAHRALVTAATGGEGDALVISDTGELGIQLGPVVSSLKALLTERGFALAGMIPAVDATIVIAQADALALVGPMYTAAATVGFLLPWAALVLVLAGVLVARSRMVGALGAGVAILVGGAVTAVALAVTGTVLQTQAPGLGLPSTAVGTVWSSVTGRMSDTAVVLIVLGVAVALIAWLAGPSAPARRVRTVGDGVLGSARRGLRARGMDTGTVGDWLAAQRTLVHVGIVVVAVLVLVFAPLTAGVVVSVIVGGLVVWLAAELLQRRPEDAATAGVDGSPVAP